MDWNTLIAVALGGFISLITVVVSNRYQSREREKDRQEQKRDAIRRASEKWIERDILIMMEGTEKLLRLVNEASRNNLPEQQDLLNREYIQTMDSIVMLVNSFPDDKLRTGINHLNMAIADFMATATYDESEKRKSSLLEKWQAMSIAAGNFHAALREKMISIHNYE